MFVNKRRVAGAGVAGFAGALLVLPLTATATGAPPVSELPAPAPVCEMVRLPVPPDVTGSQVTGGDHTGRYLAGEGLVSDGVESTRIALQWVHGQVRVVDTSALRPYVDVHVSDVSSHGAVVGYRLTDASEFHTDAWVYQAGRARVLPALHPGDSATAVAINSGGDIVGTNAGTVDGVYREWAVLWPADRPGTVRELIVIGESPQVVKGVDIDDDGTILGFVGFQPTEQQHPYVWPGRGSGYPLAAPDGTGYPRAAAVHNGQVVGSVLTWDGDTGYSVATRWDLTTRTAKVVSTTPSSAVAVNRQGTIAIDTALIYRDGTVRELGGIVRVLSDRHTAAGMDAGFPIGTAITWTHC